MRNTYFLLIIVAFLEACDSKQVDTSVFAKEMEDRKIKQLSQGKISSHVHQVGSIIEDTLNKAISELNHCNWEDLALKKSLEKDFDVTIKRHSLNTTGLLEQEAILLDAYLYNIEQKLEVNPNTQNLRNGSWLYTSPILWKTKQDTLCLKPNAKSGKMIGMLSLVFSEKTLIKKIK